jgi:hypothetical protein
MEQSMVLGLGYLGQGIDPAPKIDMGSPKFLILWKLSIVDIRKSNEEKRCFRVRRFSVEMFVAAKFISLLMKCLNC